jgi:hypothetical protein
MKLRAPVGIRKLRKRSRRCLATSIFPGCEDMSRIVLANATYASEQSMHDISLMEN